FAGPEPFLLFPPVRVRTLRDLPRLALFLGPPLPKQQPLKGWHQMALQQEVLDGPANSLRKGCPSLGSNRLRRQHQDIPFDRLEALHILGSDERSPIQLVQIL